MRFITLSQLRKTAESLLIKINDNKDYLENKIPVVEPINNVRAMLTSYGLNASANLTQAQAGTAETDHAIAG